MPVSFMVYEVKEAARKIDKTMIEGIIDSGPSSHMANDIVFFSTMMNEERN